MEREVCVVLAHGRAVGERAQLVVARLAVVHRREDRHLESAIGAGAEPLSALSIPDHTSRARAMIGRRGGAPHVAQQRA